jgi:hypothetical protein
MKVDAETKRHAEENLKNVQVFHDFMYVTNFLYK